MKYLWAFLTLCAMTGAAFAESSPTRRFVVELEGSPVWQTRNDVRVPNEPPATRFALRDLVGSGPWWTGRAYLTWNVSDRDGIRLLIAPLAITETGLLSESVQFAGQSFAPATPTRGKYVFHSYRLSYRRRFHEGRRWTVWLGATAKIRDAEIALTQGTMSARKTDVGFVPLLHVAAEHRFSERWKLHFDGDALAGGPGRAADVAVKLGYDCGRDWSLAAGYRTVEGGADVKEVFAFAWLHYAAISMTRRF